MFKFLLTFLMVGLLSISAIAQTASPFLSGTSITRPQVDIQCDAARDAKDYTSERDLCIKAASAYSDIINQLVDYKILANKDYLIEEMRYNEALSFCEVVSAYHLLRDDKNGHAYAVIVYKVYSISRIYFWSKLNAAAGRKFNNTNKIDYGAEPLNIQQKINAAFTDDDLELIENYNILMNYIDELYPDVTASSSINT